jgi:syntaxin 5
VAKDKSLFNDRSNDMEQLTGVIKMDLQSLSQDIDGLQEFVKRNKSGQAQSDEHTDRVVNNLRSEVLNATKSFAEVLQLRSKNLKATSDRRKQFSSGRTLGHRPRPSKFLPFEIFDF